MADPSASSHSAVIFLSPLLLPYPYPDSQNNGNYSQNNTNFKNINDKNKDINYQNNERVKCALVACTEAGIITVWDLSLLTVKAFGTKVRIFMFIYIYLCLYMYLCLYIHSYVYVYIPVYTHIYV
jgi:hypothetical protein